MQNEQNPSRTTYRDVPPLYFKFDGDLHTRSRLCKIENLSNSFSETSAGIHMHGVYSLTNISKSQAKRKKMQKICINRNV